MKEVSVYTNKPQGQGEIMGVLDRFGPFYHVTHAVHEAHSVLGIMAGDVKSGVSMPMHFRIIRPVHRKTVKALARRHGSRLPLAHGHWYEVHAD